jgi:hypothetical protein
MTDAGIHSPQKELRDKFVIAMVTIGEVYGAHGVRSNPAANDVDLDQSATSELTARNLR